MNYFDTQPIWVASSNFSDSVIFEKLAFTDSIPKVLDKTGCKKCRYFLWENVPKSVRERIEDILRSVKTKPKISKFTNESFFILYQLQLSASQNKPVALVLCFVRVHHVFGYF